MEFIVGMKIASITGYRKTIIQVDQYEKGNNIIFDNGSSILETQLEWRIKNGMAIILKN